MRSRVARLARVAGFFACITATLFFLGAASPEGFGPGTRVAGPHQDAVLILRNEGVGSALRAHATGGGAGVLASSETGYGVHGMTDAANRSAVFGISSGGVGVRGQSETNDGVVGTTASASKSGVWGHSVAGVGVAGSSTNNDGIVGTTQASNRTGVYGRSAHGIGVTAESSSGTALYVRGTSIFERYASFQGGHGDIAENYKTGEALEPGDVVVISAQGGLMLTLAREGNDPSVAGVVATDPSLRLSGGLPDGEGVPLAIAGRVLCKVDASFGPIAPGDLLTTSPTPGHAMLAQPITIGGVNIFRPGTILGKALEPCEEGTGLIQILVTLQ